VITAERVNGIVRFQANGLPVVSLYCRVDPGASQREVRARVDSLLDQIHPLAKDRTLDHRYRLSMRTEIERIKDALGSERWRPGTVAVFSCSGRGLYEEIPLPRRVREQVMVDATPLARPMLAVLGEYSRACVLVVNREAAPVWEMYQDEMREVETITDPLRKAANTGTRAEDRIQTRMDEQAKRHFRRVTSLIGQLLRADGYSAGSPPGTPRTSWTNSRRRSALIEAAEEQEALIDQLEARRGELLRRLGQPVRTNGS
jgi:peptide subunit release factor 1 (eRF1)